MSDQQHEGMDGQDHKSLEKPTPPAPTLVLDERPLTDEEILERYSHPNAPPPPGTAEASAFTQALARRRVRNIEVGRKTTEKDLETVLKSEGLETGERTQLVLQIRTQLKKNNRRRFWLTFWAGWVMALSLLAGIGYAGFVWAQTKVEFGRHTVPVSCKIPFGDTELEARRYLSYPTRKLGGIQWTLSDWSSEEFEIVLNGSPLTIVGIDKKGKPWRKEYGKGDLGVSKLPASDMYWLVGRSVKETTPVAHENFCK